MYPNNQTPSTANQRINPTTGLPMIDDMEVDVGGSPYGVDIYEEVSWMPTIDSAGDWQQSAEFDIW